VLESLIKAGAFDSLGLARAHLMTTADGALEAGQRRQRERVEGQASFFDLLPAPAAAPKPEPVSVVPEWDDDERLAFEKEVLGFYISGHPLARYASVAESLGITTTSDLAGKTPGSRVLLFGQVAAVKETSTKSGSRMAFATLEDMNGTVEVTIFPEPFKAAAEHLRSREPLLIRGRLDDSDKGRVVLAEDVRPLAYALQEAATRSTPAGEPSALRIRVRAGDDADRLISTVKALCGAHRGPVPIFLHLLLPAQEVVVRARALTVSPSPELLKKLDELLGPDASRVEHAGSA
jgi:DNA polymerase-3 subunit alpha